MPQGSWLGGRELTKVSEDECREMERERLIVFNRNVCVRGLERWSMVDGLELGQAWSTTTRGKCGFEAMRGSERLKQRQ